MRFQGRLLQRLYIARNSDLGRIGAVQCFGCVLMFHYHCHLPGLVDPIQCNPGLHSDCLCNHRYHHNR